MKIYIIVNAQVEGVHRWKDCPFDDVSFLGEFHRHIFHITATKSVKHAEREVEIIRFKRKIEDYLHDRYGKVCFFGERSCETIALELTEMFGLSECTVLEDGENGARVVAEEKD